MLNVTLTDQCNLSVGPTDASQVPDEARRIWVRVIEFR